MQLEAATSDVATMNRRSGRGRGGGSAETGGRGDRGDRGDREDRGDSEDKGDREDREDSEDNGDRGDRGDGGDRGEDPVEDTDGSTDDKANLEVATTETAKGTAVNSPGPQVSTYYVVCCVLFLQSHYHQY